MSVTKQMALDKRTHHIVQRRFLLDDSLLLGPLGLQLVDGRGPFTERRKAAVVVVALVHGLKRWIADRMKEPLHVRDLLQGEGGADLRLQAGSLLEVRVQRRRHGQIVAVPAEVGAWPAAV